ncbi:hypothetical protein [Neorhizobium galegae]|uniref:Uncharacterized protein n=1 Tax=Neorhizobium galegae bv. officinalis TaxID=323656 RepID=A0A0T7GSX9_NEOGA|nr:hypothetical protein [Neorhizobium galegae]CDZ50389.1 Hypothetical protein NGAL_HAMBI1189_34500 [Neorhizobium galegae bv. officinalis]
MADLIKEIVTGLVETALKELLGKSHGRTPAKRKKRQIRSANTGRFARKTAATKTTARRAAKPATKQVSRRRTTASRSKQRSR